MPNREQAVAFYNTALQAFNNLDNPNRMTHAYQLFASAALTDPTWWEAHYQAGNNANDLNNGKAAIACYRRALECEMTDEQKGKVFINLGWKLYQEGHMSEGMKYSKGAIELAPKEWAGWVNMSCLMLNMCDTKEAIRYASEALRLAPDHPTAQTAYAFALLFGRKYSSGFRAFGSRFAYELKNFTTFPYPEWRGESDKTIYLISDQGLGDTLSFARFLPEVCKRSKYVHAYVHAALMRCFTNAFIDIPNLNLFPTSTPYPPADYWTTFVSLPYALDLDDETIISTPPVKIPVWNMPKMWKIEGRKMHIGIGWAGSPLNKIDCHRNIPVEMFFELSRVPGIQLYSLQVGEKSQEVHIKGGSSLVRDVVPYINDVVDTVSLMQHLDLVIGCESALGHICSTVGMPYCLPYSFRGRDYRVGVDGKDRLWTPQHKIFMQDESATWDKPFDEIIDYLKELVRKKDLENAS
jgi:Tfp pilus assembly protein PilF